MAYDHQEQEQLDSFKAWWDSYGNLVVLVIVAVALSFAAVSGWRWHQRSQAVEAGVLYEQLQKILETKDSVKSKELTGTLIERYGRTIYAPLAALQTAKLNYDGGDVSAAKAQLRWIIDKSGNEQIALVARIRLAGLLLDEKAYDEALTLLNGEVPAADVPVFADRRGDILRAQGKLAEARTAYQQALDKIGKQHPLRTLIQLKLDSLPVQS